MTEIPRRKDEFETVEFQPRWDGESISLELHHSHLPQLDETGFVDWDRGTEQVTRGDNFEEIRSLLELLDDHQDELPDGWP